LYASPTKPRTTQPLSDEAVEDIAVTHEPRLLPARKKSSLDLVFSDEIYPTKRRRIK